MAKSLKWCHPISVWNKYFSYWINTAPPKNLLDVKIFFYLRPIYSNEELTDELKNIALT